MNVTFSEQPDEPEKHFSWLNAGFNKQAEYNKRILKMQKDHYDFITSKQRKNLLDRITEYFKKLKDLGLE